MASARSNDAAVAALTGPPSPDDEDVWTSPPFSPSNTLQTSLRDFESVLRCGICRHFLNIAVSIQGCQHSFCSECIRRSIQASVSKGMSCPKCPACNVALDKNPQKVLKPNRPLQMLVKSFQELRAPLRQSLADAQTNSGASSRNADETDVAAADGEDRVSGRRRSPRDISARRSGEASSDDDEANEEPASMVAIAEEAEVMEVNERLARRPKPYYETLKKGKKSKIVDLCRNDGLSTEGTTEQLIKRHEEFMLLYNAECDSMLPQRSQVDIAREVMRREKGKKKAQTAAFMSGTSNHATFAKQICDTAHKDDSNDDSREAPVSSGDAKFDNAWEEGFAALIAEGRKIMPQKRRKWTKEDLDRSIQGVEPMLSKPSSRAAALRPGANNGQTTMSASTLTSAIMSPPGTSQATWGEQKPPLMSTSGAAFDAHAPAVPSRIPQTSVGLHGQQYSTPSALQPRNPYKQAATSVASSQASTVSIGSAPSPRLPVPVRPSAHPSRGQRTLEAVSSSAMKNPYAQRSERKRKASVLPTSGPWTCHACTYRNEEHTWAHAKCALCREPRSAGTDDGPSAHSNSESDSRAARNKKEAVAPICIDL